MTGSENVEQGKYSMLGDIATNTRSMADSMERVLALANAEVGGGWHHHQTVHNVNHVDCLYCVVERAIAELETLAEQQKDKSNEHPSMRGRARAEEQRTWKIAQQLKRSLPS